MLTGTLQISPSLERMSITPCGYLSIQPFSSKIEVTGSIASAATQESINSWPA